MMSGISLSLSAEIWSLSISLRFFRRLNRNWSWIGSRESVAMM